MEKETDVTTYKCNFPGCEVHFKFSDFTAVYFRMGH